MQQISATELAAVLKDDDQVLLTLLDVREPWEFGICHIEGSVSIPMNALPERLGELDREQAIVCICHHGVRSLHVGQYLEKNGFSRVINLVGGVDAWAAQVDPQMPTY